MNFSSPLFSYCFKATARVSLLLATASVFRKRSGLGMTLHLTLLDMRLEHVHCSVTFSSLKITQMLGPVWHRGLCVAGQRPAIFISTTPCNPSPSHTLSVCCPENRSCVSHFISFEVLWLLHLQAEPVCNRQVLITDQQLGFHLSDIGALQDWEGFAQSGHFNNVVCHPLPLTYPL